MSQKVGLLADAELTEKLPVQSKLRICSLVMMKVRDKRCG
jgi:hypothetical protein